MIQGKIVDVNGLSGNQTHYGRYKARCNGLSGNRTHYGRPLAARWMNSLRERGLTSVNTKRGGGVKDQSRIGFVEGR